MARLCFSLYYTINIYSSWQQREKQQPADREAENDEKVRQIGEKRRKQVGKNRGLREQQQRGEWRRATAAGHAIELMPVGRTMLRCIEIE